MSESREQQPQIRKPPYTVDPGERESDGSDCWWINSEEGSVAEMICPADDAEATARFLSRAGNCHEEHKRLLNVSLNLLSDVYNSRASQRFSAIGLSRIKSHIADLRACLAEKES